MSDPIVALFRDWQLALSLEPSGNIVRRSPGSVSCYFEQLVDSNGRRLVGMRLTKSFRRALKRKHRLISWVDHSLRVVDDNTFQLRDKFDIMFDDQNVHILRILPFVRLGRVHDQIQKVAADNMATIRAQFAIRGHRRSAY